MGDRIGGPTRDRSYGGSNARKLFQTTPKEKGPAEAGPSTWGMRKEGFSRSKAIRGAGDGSRDLQRKSDCVFPATKDVTLLQKRPRHGDSGARSRTGLPVVPENAATFLSFSRKCAARAIVMHRLRCALRGNQACH